ncbi:MAG: restriction endonuclease subunit S [Clostridia bacterium]|nr:restriction endonuclease subunit S [Clostridia bacterium]
MSELENLIQRLCPDGVEYRHLVDVANVLYGYPFDASLFTTQNEYMSLIRIRDIKCGKTETYYKGDVLEDYIIRKNDILVGMDGEFNLARWQSSNALLNQRVCKIYTKNTQVLLDGFLFHLLLPLFKNIEKEIQGSTVKHLSAKIINTIKIPVPPIEVQREIVRILDNFTELKAELTAELTARKKQYEYYRDTLILGQDVERKTLGEIATELYRGAGIKRDEVTKEGIECVRYGEIYTTYDIWFDKCVSHTNEEKITSKKYFENGDILFAITGESVEEIAKSCAYVGDKKCLAGGDIVVMKHNQNPKYLAYALSTTEAQRQKSYGKIKSKVVHASAPSISAISIPLPSLDKQARIADILDKFHRLVTDISQGIPAEIAARKKQYEYYRDKLLTFKEKVISG